MLFRYLVLCILYGAFAVASLASPPEAALNLLASGLSENAGGVMELTATDSGNGRFLSPGVSLTPGHYHALVCLESTGPSLDSRLAEFMILDASEEKVIQACIIPPDIYRAGGGSARMDLEFRLDRPRPVRLVVRGVSPDTVRVECFLLSPRFTSNIPPLCSTAAADRWLQDPVIEQSAPMDLNGQWQLQPARPDLLFMPEPDGWSETPIQIPSPWNVNRFNKVEVQWRMPVKDPESGQWKVVEDTPVNIGPDCVFYPSYPEKWEALEAAWLKKKFYLPPGSGKTHWRVHFDSVMYSAEVYVNGKYIGFHEDGFIPFSFDVTEALKPGGENEILLGVRSWRSYTRPNGGRPFPWGSFWGGVISGVWQGVRLEPGAPVEISNVYIETLDDPKRLRVTYELLNSTSGQLEVSLISSITPALNRLEKKPVLPEAAKTEVVLPPRSLTSQTVEIPWPDAPRWEPEKPRLFNLASVLKLGQKKISVNTERFGFRIFEVKGNKLFLNGRRIKLRGDAWHFIGIPMLDKRFPEGWYQLCRDSGVNAVRLHAQIYPRHFIDAAEESGMLIIDESAHWASGLLSWYDEEFLARMKEHLSALVRRDRNSPSVIAWSVANEVMAGHRSWPDNNAGSEERIKEYTASLMEHVRRLDQHRPVSSDGDHEMKSFSDWVSYHYPGTWPLPDEKPVTIGESSGLYYATPPQAAPQGGEEVYTSWDARCRAVAEDFYRRAISYRQWTELVTPFNLLWYCLKPLPFDMEQPVKLPGGVTTGRFGPYCSTLNPGVSSALPLYQPNAAYEKVRQAIRPLQVFPLEQDRHFHAENLLTRRYHVHNGTRFDLNLEVNYSWSINEQASFGQGHKQLHLPAGSFQPLVMAVPLPEVDRRESLTLHMVFQAGGTRIMERQFDYNLHPAPKKKIELILNNQLLGLSGGAGVVKNLLPQARIIKPDEIAEIMTSPEWKGGILAAGGDLTLSSRGLKTLRSAVRENGLRVLVLGSSFSLADADMFLKTVPGEFEKVFLSYGSHPITENLSNSMLSGWQPAVARGSFAGLNGKSGRPLLTSGDGKPVMVEIRDGRGLYIFSALEILSQLGRQPAAEKLLAQSLRYAGEYKPVRPRKVLLSAGSLSEASDTLSRLQVDFTPLKSEPGSLPPDALMVVDFEGLEGQKLKDQLNLLKSSARPGMNFFIWALTPEQQQRMKQVLNDTEAPDWIRRVSGLALDRAGCLQLIRSSGAAQPVSGIHLDDLYQLDRKPEDSIIEYALHPGDSIMPYLELPEFDWRRWAIPWVTEPYHLGSIERALKEGFPDGVAFGRLEGEPPVYILQIPPAAPGHKNQRVFNQIFSNLGAGFRRETRAVSRSFNADPEGFIRTWWVRGPFQAKDGPEALARDFLQDQGGQREARPSADKGWRPYRSPTPKLDISGIPDAGYRENAAVYLATWVHSPRPYGRILDSPDALGLYLSLGSDDGAAVWLNGEEIYRNPDPRPHRFDQDRIGPLRLESGWNLLVIKVSQYSLTWDFSCRILGKNLQPADGLTFALVPRK